MYIRKNIFLLFTLFTFTSAGVFAQLTDNIKLGNPDVGDLKIVAFNLTKDARVKVEGTGGSFTKWDNQIAFYGWILDADTREIVWTALDRDFEEELSDIAGLIDFEAELDLKKGNYEAYYVGIDNNYYYKMNNFNGIWNKLFGSRKRNFRASNIDDLFMTLRTSGAVMNKRDSEEFIDDYVDKAIVSFIRVRDGEYLKEGFSLTKETKLKVYSVGEGQRKNVYDYAWIYDVKNNKRVWSMNDNYPDWAGGAEKNILVRETITLPAGSYRVHYVTDDSHSFERWNALPPDDPQFWGVVVSLVNESDRANVKPFKEVDVVKPLIELIRIGDDEFVSQGLKLEKDMDIRILCLGEGPSKDNMVDAGWIINAETRKSIWDMRGNWTDHAGGADKNRMVDEVIKLKKGSYIVYYSSDGSHSFEEWNSTPPYERERWGITIWAADENDSKFTSVFHPDDFKNENVIAEIVRVRDDDYSRENFTLESDSRVRVVAYGEGDRGGMYDFGWIENRNTRKIVWEMTYRKTEHGGGADKNRYFNDTILLEAGEYTLYYESDGSHSYRDWNASPPRDEEMYGITLLKE
ncbi:MAG: hypothetical protein K9J12_10730 [Melioribacteraceae bacterium]|nr:hypothetical protein [Melioribacteraceae bacterium]MCF8264797.1 hypothetical protein [Melioribacteraceae bacterium]